MKSFFPIIAVLFVSGFILTGCSVGQQNSNPNNAPAANQKQGETTKVGSISKAGSSYFLTPQGGQAEIIESYSVELEQYVGQTVTVTGQYSGDTLYVGSVQ